VVVHPVRIALANGPQGRHVPVASNYLFSNRHPNPNSIFLIPLRRSPFGIVADEEGIEERTRCGDRRRMRWEDARLLEVRKPQSDGLAIEYILYRRHGAIKWATDYPTLCGDTIPDGMTRQEMLGRERALVALIAARTGLVPRTFERTLQATPTRTTHIARRPAW
jgi:hypothetical protein